MKWNIKLVFLFILLKFEVMFSFFFFFLLVYKIYENVNNDYN